MYTYSNLILNTKRLNTVGEMEIKLLRETDFEFHGKVTLTF